MADNFNTKISKTLLAHDINLAQADAAMRKDVMAVMNALEEKTVDNIARLGPPSNYASVSAQNKALNLLTTSQAPTTAKAFKQMSDVTGVSLTKLGAVESEFVVNSLNRAITVDLGLNKLSPEVIRLLPGKALIEGAPFTTWFKKQGEDFQLAFSNQMREGIVNGETIDDMVRRVRGTKANGFKDGIMATSRRNAQTLVRSSALATVNKARESVYATNSDVIKGQQWLSTLDSRTSDICISLDGSAWYLSGKPMPGTVHSYLGPPPAHFNCRSTLVPVTKSFSELSKSKSAKAKLRSIPKSKQRALRASMDGAVSNKLNYEEWLKTKSPGFQLDVLGPTKLRLWQSGQLSLKNLIDQSHNPMAVDALVTKAGVPKITLDQALKTAAVEELPVTSQGVTYKSSKQWYDEFADKSATVDSILAAESDETVAQLAAIQKKINGIKTTAEQHKVNGKWTADRQKVHDDVIRNFLNKATVAAAKPAPGVKPNYVMFGGRGGSGKGKFTTPKSKGGLEVVDKDKYIILDADAIKEMLPGYEGWNAYHFHQESSELFKRISAIAARLKINVVHDMTMRTVSSATNRAAMFAKKGYSMEGYYMFLPPQEAAKRAISRFRGFDGKFTGRYVPPEVVLGNTANEIAFDTMKKQFGKWKFYDNQGDGAVLVGRGGGLSDVSVKPISTAAVREADKALAASLKAGEGAAADAAKAAAKAADDAMAQKLAKQVAEKEAQLAKAAQEVAEKQAKIDAIKAEQLQGAKDEYYAAKIAGQKVPPDVHEALVINMSVDELEVFVKQVDDAIDKAAAAQAALQKKLADAQQAFMADTIAGKAVADDVLDVLLKNMSSAELMEFKAQSLTAKAAVDAAAAAKVAETNAEKVIDSIKAQKATFEKRAYIKLDKKFGDFQFWKATEQLDAVVKQVEVDKAAKKITDGISNYKKAVLNGKVPPPAATKVFNSLDSVKQQSIIDDIAKKQGAKQVADTPPTLAESLADYKSGKLSDAEWIEAYNKAQGTYTFDVQKTILSASDAALKNAAKSMAGSAETTLGKAVTSAPGAPAAKLKQSAQQLVDEFNTPTSQLSTEQFKVKASALLGEDFTQAKAFEPFSKLQEIAGDIAKAEAHIAAKAAPVPVPVTAKLQRQAKKLFDEMGDGSTPSLNTIAEYKGEVGALLGEDLSKAGPMTVLQKLNNVIEAKLPAKATKKIATKTVAQIQDDAQEFLDKFRFGEFDENEAIEKAAAILGNAKQVPAFLKLEPAGKDNVIDMFVVQLKAVAKNTDDAKKAIKKQGLQVAEKLPEPTVPPPKPPPPPEIKPTVQAPASPVNNAPDMDNLTRIGEQKGSNPGGLFQDSTTGEKWYVKTPASEEIARNEVLAAKLYEKMGIEVPDLHTVQFGGKPSVASRIVDGLSENSTALRAGEVAGVNEGFVADAFLANWDVVGLGYDNLLVKAGRAVRVDTGGALRYRAQGGLKGNAFGKVVDEIDSLRNPANNSQSAGVFGRITDAELKAGARKVVALTDDDITELVVTYGPLDAVENKALVETLIARRNDIKKRFKIRAKKRPPAKPPEDLNADVTVAELQQIDDARGNGFVLTRDKDQIEDQAVLAWNETTTAGVKRSMLQLKIRGDAAKTLNDEIAKTVQKKPSAIELAGFDSKIESSVRALKHRVANDLDYDTKMLTRVNDTLEEHERVRTALQAALARDEIPKATLEKFDKLYDPWVKGLVDIRGRNGVGGKVQGIESIPDGIFKSGVIGEIKLVPKLADTSADIRWTKKEFNFEEKKLKNGNVVVTDSKVNPISSGGGWYETEIDGVTVRYFSRDTVNGNFALQDRLELIAPGKTHEQALGVLRKLGVNADRASDVNAEELYLRQIMQHATSATSGSRKKKFASIVSELGAIADDSARLDRARKLASEYMKVPDITKTPAYNYRGQYQAFNQGQRHLLRPDLNGADWDEFTDGYRLHHSNTSNSSLPQVIDMVLNSGGNFISTTDKIRRGVALQGMSPDSDLRTGGASYFFTRIKSASQARRQPGIVWKSKHVNRLDSISYNHDAYGEVADNYVAENRRTGIREWTQTAERGRNETIFKNGLSIFDDLDVIVTSTNGERDDILKVFRKHGLAEWPDGRQLEDVVIYRG